MRYPLFALIGIAILTLSASALAQQIRGDYIETRSADVYTGSCFANGEVNLVGNEAILAWHVQSGSWDGMQLDGLTVAAAVRARATLGDPYADPYPAKSVLDKVFNQPIQGIQVGSRRSGHCSGEIEMMIGVSKPEQRREQNSIFQLFIRAAHDLAEQHAVG